MLLLIGFAFLAGIVTVLSPCILPILPVILSAGATGGKSRPLGIIIGLVLSFTFFTLTLTAIVHATGLSATALRFIAIGLIFLFGIILIFPSLSNWFAKVTSPLANAGQKIQSSQQKSGFSGGFILGLALGLLWTPCAGPILASITTLVATGEISWQTILMTFSYSIGAGLPMYLIAYGGNKVIRSSQFLSKHTEQIRKVFGSLMIILAIALVFNWEMLFQEKVAKWIPSITIENNPVVQKQLQNAPAISATAANLPNEGKAPELTGITGWINTPPLTLSGLKGKVVLIDFWTYSCINCLRTLPYIEKWYDTYKDQGLVIIGVHTPEFEFEKDLQNVEEAAQRLGVKYPVALDNNYRTWIAYHNHYWPAHYLIDQDGNIRMEHFGEGGYIKTENAIRELLGLSPLQQNEPYKSGRALTPETYLGLARGNSYNSQNKIQANKTAHYDYTNSLKKDEVGLKGDWEFENEFIIAQGDNCYLNLNFQAKQVYLVLSGSSETPVQVYLDDRPAGQFVVDGDKKYDVVRTTYGRHDLSLKIPPGISAYAFTFGDD